MADVNIQQTPDRGSGSGWVVAIVLVVVLLLVAWFIFGRGGMGTRESKTTIEVNTPSGGGGTGGGTGGQSGGGTGGQSGGGGTKTP